MTLLPVHIAAGSLGILAGYVALFARKGARVHLKSGAIFVAAMLVMASSGTVMATIKMNGGNIMGGAVAIYMVITGLLAIRRPRAGVDGRDVAALMLGLAIVTAAAVFALQAARSEDGRRFGYSPGLYLVFGSITMLGVIGDLRMLLARRLEGTPRITRHLWRMCFSLFIATGSFFLGQAKVFPKPLRIMPLLAAPVLLVLVLMLYWLVRARLKREFSAAGLPSQMPNHAPIPAPGASKGASAQRQLT